MASQYSPTLIKSTGQRGPWAATNYGVFARNNGLYCLIQWNPGGGFVSNIFESLDAGQTWNELDAAHRVPSGDATGQYDGVSIFVTAFRVAGAGLQPIHLVNFDFTTKTWGAIYGTVGAPTCTECAQLLLLPNGQLIVTHDTAPPTPVPPASNYFAAVFSAPNSSGAWSAVVDVGTNMAQLAGWHAASRIIVSQSGAFAEGTRIHFTFTNLTSGLNSYQQTDLSLTLGTFIDLSNAGLVVFSGCPIGTALLYKGSLLIPAVFRDAMIHQFVTAFIAPNPAAPVFTMVPSPGFESAFSAANFLNPDNVWKAAVQGNVLSGVYTAFDINGTPYQDLHQLTLVNADPTVGANWTEQNVWQGAIDAPVGFNPPGQQFQLAGVALAPKKNQPLSPWVLVTMDAQQPPALAVEEAFFMGVFGVSPDTLVLDQQQLMPIVLPNPARPC